MLQNISSSEWKSSVSDKHTRFYLRALFVPLKGKSTWWSKSLTLNIRLKKKELKNLIFKRKCLKLRTLIFHFSFKIG